MTNCTSGFADPNLRICDSSCSLSRYRDPSTKTCVLVCPSNSFRDPSFICKTDCSPLRIDRLTGNCVEKCSNGTWGHQNVCINRCPNGTWGHDDGTTRDCKTIAEMSLPNLFADNVTQTWVLICPQAPLTFADTSTKRC